MMAVVAIRLLLAALLLVPSTPAVARPSPVIDRVVSDLCRRDVVLLGEHAGHGDGRTIATKTQIVRQLVERCGFNAVLFEASYYEFANFRRRLHAGEPATREMLWSAVGGLWNRYAETQPLIDFLYDRARRRRLFVGGIDDQLSGWRQPYANDVMPAELAGLLPAERRTACEQAMHRRIYSDYPADAPASPATREQLRGCLREIRSVLVARGDSERLPLVDNSEWTIARDFTQPGAPAWMAARDASMAQNFAALRAARGPRAKVIVWAATVHVARSASFDARYTGVDNLGAALSRAFGRRAFVLGFGAASGSVMWGGQARTVPPVAPDSLESRALAGTAADIVYLGGRRLAGLGEINASLFSIDEPQRAPWSRIVDGAIVFRAEQAPTVAIPFR